MTPRALMIFAAGLGTRMGALTRDRPKPLIEVAGIPLLDRALALAREAGVGRIVVNTHAHAAQMQAHLARAAPEALVSHEPELLETGGGLARALPLLDADPVFTLNADMVWSGPNPLTALAAAWDPSRMDALLCLVPRAAATGHAGPGDFFAAPGGALTRRGAAPAADFVYAGAQIIRAGALAGHAGPVFSLNPVWDRLIAAGRLFGCLHRGGWADVGRPEGIALAEAALAR
ncbi:MAG TPA: nucleotidyltransferase family protein [Amaricoccus sp.]|uniref:nucleotidyltransferase family protein n=1 Tax=Amaricoccus sp. TaxID=1872485 RepID=UPI002C4010CE|nr:nucleotidyltransferase family protein [Amaricoccus sp.]HMQ95027.1 nucleotidyltransferase family protein [Amaricoccus sp.]HMR52904.1 nucleotidyltransferase family protein [Amaricoccus sp.]HMR59260.1 nucleotidyltransferase family protein [Amaricoccus sp.]HMT97754.1 nucleotidyltransferase family protein [Amaricoccus sp.]